MDIPNQTEEICLAAVKQDEDALAFVQEEFRDVCIGCLEKRSHRIEKIIKRLWECFNG